MLQDKIKKIKTALSELGCDVYHWFAPSEHQIPYVVWNEDSEDNSFEADNHKQDFTVAGYVEFYTVTELDPIADDITSILDSIDDCSYKLENVVYGDPQDEDDNLIHYTWSWVVS